jgi:hypothetical protein
MDSAYDADHIHEQSRSLGHVPITDSSRRQAQPFSPSAAPRLTWAQQDRNQDRTMVEFCESRVLKNPFPHVFKHFPNSAIMNPIFDWYRSIREENMTRRSHLPFRPNPQPVPIPGDASFKKRAPDASPDFHKAWQPALNRPLTRTSSQTRHTHKTLCPARLAGP